MKNGTRLHVGIFVEQEIIVETFGVHVGVCVFVILLILRVTKLSA